MIYLDKYNLYIDNDFVVYRTYSNHTYRGSKFPSCFLVQVEWNLLPNGYLYTRHRANGKNHSIYLHRLIAEAFIENPDNKPTVDHINHIRTDNRVENLRWATRLEQVEFRKVSIEHTRKRKREYARKYYQLKKKAA